MSRKALSLAVSANTRALTKKAWSAVGIVLAVVAFASSGKSAFGQTVEFRIVETTGQSVVTSSDAVLDFAVQARVTGGSSLGGFGISLVIVGEPDTYGTLALDRIMSSGGSGTYYTGTPQAVSTVGQGGLAAQFAYLGNLSPSFNGVFNMAAGTFTNDPGSQEINSIFGASLGSWLLHTPGIDTDANDLPDTWSGNAAGLPASDGDTATLDPTVAAAYFARGQFVDVYRFQYTVSNLSVPRVLHIGFGPAMQAQICTEIGYSNGLWQTLNSNYTGTIVTSGLDIPVRVYAGPFGDLNSDNVVNCADAIAAASAWGHVFGDAEYRVELDYDYNGTNDAVDKAQFDAICSCTLATASCGPGWIGGATPPDDSVAVSSVIAWDRDGTAGPAPALPVISFTDGVLSSVAAWDGVNWAQLASEVIGSIDALAVDNNNSLIAAGNFSSIGGISANNIASWDGTSWHALGAGTDGRIHAVYNPGDGTLVVGGEFTLAATSSANHVAKWNGSAWSGFGKGTNGSVFALGRDPNGYLCVGGSFTRAGTSTTRGVAVWNGSSWGVLGSGIGDNSVNALASLSNGNLVVGGSFTSAGGVSNTGYIAMWDGSNWSAMGSGFDGPVNALFGTLTGGKILAGGSFSATGTSSMNRVARWDDSTSTWSSLGSGISGASSTVQSITQLPSPISEIVTGGTFTIAGDASAENLARWSDSGKPWIAIPSLNGQETIVDGNATLVVSPAVGYDYAGPLTYVWKHSTTTVNDGAGGASTGGGTVSGATTNWMTITGLATSDFGGYTCVVSNGCGSVTSSAETLQFYGDLNSDNTVDCADAIAAASAWGHTYGDAEYRVELDYNVDGVLDASDKAHFEAVCSCTEGTATCGPGWIAGALPQSSSTSVTALTTWDPDGYDADTGPLPAILVAGFSNSGTLSVATWDGATWTTLASGISGTIYAIAESYDGTLVVGGSFSSIGGVSADNIAYWDHTNWNALGAGTNAPVRSLYISPFDNSIFVGGDFTQAGGSSNSYIARWNGAWHSVGSGTNGSVLAMGVDLSGNLAVGGLFTSAGSVSNTTRIATGDGSAWAALGTGVADNAVQSLLPLSNGDLVVGGSFTGAGGVSNTSRIARWDGTSWNAMGVGFDSSVRSLARLANGDVIAGGEFASTGTTSMSRIARWNGSAWASLAGGVAGISSEVIGLAVMPSNELVAGGVFTIAGGAVAENLGRWSDSGKPWIAAQPIRGQIVALSSNATISATVATGYDYAGPLTCTWKLTNSSGTTTIVNGAGGASTGGGTVSGTGTGALSILGIASSDLGSYTVQFTNACGNATSNGSGLSDHCDADHNHDGFLTVQDIFDFLNDWFAGCIGSPLPGGCMSDADFNHDATLGVQDIFDFLSAWFAGCA
jgi:trimeric autotransporter adhesin